MSTSIKPYLIVISLISAVVLTGCVKKEEPTQINAGKDNEESFNPDDLVFYELGKSQKSLEAENDKTKTGEPRPNYVECESDSDCLVKNKHIYNPLDPEHTGLAHGEKIPVETKPQAQALNDEIFDLIDELGTVQEDLSNHRKNATTTKSVISLQVEKAESQELKDEIEKEMQTINARKMMQ